MISKFPSYIFIDDASVRETRISNMRKSSDFEVGPSKVTAYSCKTKYQLRFSMSLCLKDYEEYLRWYEEILKQGTQQFLMVCPIRGTEYRYRFLDNDLQFTKVNDSMRKTCLIERWGNG